MIDPEIDMRLLTATQIGFVLPFMTLVFGLADEGKPKMSVPKDQISNDIYVSSNQYKLLRSDPEFVQWLGGKIEENSVQHICPWVIGSQRIHTNGTSTNIQDVRIARFDYALERKDLMLLHSVELVWDFNTQIVIEVTIQGTVLRKPLDDLIIPASPKKE